MKLKNISGHYDTVYSIAHNNRTFIPKNVDMQRIHWNYNCVAAGEEAYFNLDDPRHISEFWRHYKELSDLYWQNRSIAQTLAYRRYQDHLEYMRKYCRSIFFLPHNSVEALVTLLLLPLLVPCGIYLNHQHQKAKAEWEQFKEEQWLQDMYFKASRVSLRSALYAHDHATGTRYLHSMDRIVSEMAQYAEDYGQNTITIFAESEPAPRFATLEEIYDKLYEPSFRDFQAKQRPCRRYNGTYLEQIREGQKAQVQKKQQSKNTRSRKTADAIEIVFDIGDMDNTGYALALSDAKRSEELLKDFCDHLMENPKLCCVTTKELNDPNWTPPFNNGLIVLNLTVTLMKQPPAYISPVFPTPEIAAVVQKCKHPWGGQLLVWDIPPPGRMFWMKMAKKFRKKVRTARLSIMRTELYVTSRNRISKASLIGLKNKNIGFKRK